VKRPQHARQGVASLHDTWEEATVQEVYKVVTAEVWAEMGERWEGSAHDLADGFIHLSTREQLPGTLAKHYGGLDGLILLSIPVGELPADALRWEPSRGGALFPHLYGTLERRWVRKAETIPLADGMHVLPAQDQNSV